MTGEEMLQNLKGLDVIAVMDETINESSELIADLNAAQLAQGIRSDGSRITPEYAALTIQLKGEKSGLAAVTDRVTLYDTGDHYRGLYAKAQGLDLEFGSTDEKSTGLQAKYDGDQRRTVKGSIYGLTEDSKEDLIQSKLQRLWEDKVEQKTGLEFD